MSNLTYGQIPDEPKWGYKMYNEQGVILLDSNVYQGSRNMIVKYTAGYANTPADLEQICIDITKVYYESANKDASVKSEKLGEYAYTLADDSRLGNLSAAIKTRLAPYVKATRYAF